MNRLRYWWAKKTGKADDPLRRCPICGRMFHKDEGVPTSYTDPACSVPCAVEYDAEMAM